MKHWSRSWRFWVLVGAVLVVSAGALVPVLAGREEVSFTATPYADVIRFEAGEPVASLQVRIYDLSGRELWDSGVVAGRILDWDRTNRWGERLAYGTYLYLAQAWDSNGRLLLQQKGKLSLLPGDRLELTSSPPAQKEEPVAITLPSLVQPFLYTINDNLTVNGSITSKQSGASNNTLFLYAGPTGTRAAFHLIAYGRGVTDKAIFTLRTDLQDATFSVYDGLEGIWKEAWRFLYVLRRLDFRGNQLDNIAKLGVGTTSPTGKLDVCNTTNQPALRIEASNGTNLIEAYNTGSGTVTGLIFRVERETGNVRADGAFYGAGFYSSSADVAEHINVSEPVEPGDLVEIDPDNPGYFRKARGPYSRLVAGVISTDPGIVLGSNSDPFEGENDLRPLLALTGRVPVKVTTENGPIRVGDLLVASSKPGYAMCCDDPSKAVGAVVGKALGAIEEGEGIIMAQVILR